MRAPALVVSLLLEVVMSSSSRAAEVRAWSFQDDAVGAQPAGFSYGRTGGGRAGQWVVRQDPTVPGAGHVLVQVDADGTDLRFPVAVLDAPVLRDLRLEVRCKPVSGKTDRACGLVFRYQDENHYYVARANALEDNVRLYHVVKGRRSQIGTWDGKVEAGVWHALAIEAQRDRLTVFWEGRPVIAVGDGTIQAAGKVGVWTKADSVTAFTALAVTPLPQGSPAR